jgi:hypothetical protein
MSCVLTIGEPAPAVDARLAASDPYRPDTIADGGGAFGLTVRAASVRGLGKRYTGGPRQDDFCLRLHEPSRTLIVAVADGVSGAPRSELGAALAVRHAAAAVARQLDRDELDWAEVFAHAAWAIVEKCAGEGAADASPATTLTVAAIDGGGRVRVAAVGDSPAYLLTGCEFEAIVGQDADPDELIGGAVDALPGAVDAIRTGEAVLEPGRVLLVCTDGLALPLGDGSGEVGQVFAEALAAQPEAIGFARLLDFSRATYDDDRTLVAVWPPSE